MASVKPIRNEIYEDLKAIEEDEAFEEARAIYKALEKNPYLGEPLYDRPDLGIFLQDCYKIYFYNKKYRVVYTLNEENEIIVIVIAIGKRDGLEVYKEADRRMAGN